MSFEILGLDHVQLSIPIGGEELSRKFFVDILSFNEIEKPENLKRKGGAWFRCGAKQIHVGTTDSLIPAKKAHPAILVHNLYEFKKYLESHGLSTREEDPLPGAVRFYLDDPFGNLLEFLEWL